MKTAYVRITNIKKVVFLLKTIFIIYFCFNLFAIVWLKATIVNLEYELGDLERERRNLILRNKMIVALKTTAYSIKAIENMPIQRLGMNLPERDHILYASRDETPIILASMIKQIEDQPKSIEEIISNKDQVIFKVNVLREDISRIIEKKFNELPGGLLLFDYPKKMTLGVKDTIEAIIAKKISEDIRSKIKDFEAEHVEPIKVNTFMKVHLEGDGFKIKTPTHEKQIVASSEPTTWKWDVTPIKSGNQTLTLAVSVRIKTPYNTEEMKDIHVFERTVKVNSNWSYFIISFFEKYWQWIISTIIGSGIIGWTINKNKNTNNNHKSLSVK